MNRIALNIFGNLYFSGTEQASTHILDTGDGLLLIDSGYPADTDALIYDMRSLHLDPDCIRWILHTHGHIDHMGGTHELVRLTGAETLIGAPDADAATGKLPLSYAEELGMKYEKTFEPDRFLYDGDRIRFGSTEVLCVATPGHTAGAMSYFFDVTDVVRKKTYRAGLHGGMGVNSLEKWYLDKYNLPYSLREDFRRSMERLMKEKVDIFLGNHMAHNHMKEKYKRLIDGDPDAFVNPDEWVPFNEYSIRYLDDMIAREES